MSTKFRIVDLFAGPGGLAEGFAAHKTDDQHRPFEIALSVEKEPSAFKTLRLRAFFRQFERAPEAYYRYIGGEVGAWDELMSAYPEQWAQAVAETKMLELGSEAARLALDPVLDRLAAVGSVENILIGGPPCQAYSLVGRARNRGIEGYDPSADTRHFLYREYIRIIGRLRPAAFVMENVKGMLSAKVDDVPLFQRIVADLESAGGETDSYVIMPLVATSRGLPWTNIIRAEQFGIPQARHRVILFGIRKDRLSPLLLDGTKRTILAPSLRVQTVGTAIGDMAPLRSGLSKSEDTPEDWRRAVIKAFKTAASACGKDGSALKEVASRLRSHATALAALENLPPRSSKTLTRIEDNELCAWLAGDGEMLSLPNHESRGHMEGDLARYAFAATFAQVHQRSPKADEFPLGLAPDHVNWSSGKFADRFRVQVAGNPSTTITSHISKDGHYFIHPDPLQCRSLTVREAARLQTFPDNYFFEGNRTQQYVQVGNAVPPLLARQIAALVYQALAA